MKTFKMLDISTGHLTVEDVTLLENPTDLSFTCAPYCEGFIINLAMFPHKDLLQIKQEQKRFSPYFFKIVERALEEKCTHINFDRDGEEYDEFQKFDW